jgi:CheY-like chemotaxis protein
MPEMDGYEATLTLRSNPRFDALPIIAMTAHTIDSDRQKCLEVGMQDHVGKPIEPEILFSKLAKWTLNRHQQTTNKLSPNQPASDTPKRLKPLQSLTTVNSNSALHLLQGDENLLLHLLLKFAYEQSETPKHLAELLKENQWDKATNKVHQIKGVAGNLHISEVFGVAKKLETVLINQEINAVDPLLNEFNVAINRFIDEIAAWRSEDLADETDIEDRNEQLPKDSDFNEIVTLLDRLIVYLETNNWNAEDCLEQVLARLGNQHNQEMKQIKNHLIDLEFQIAAECVRKLKERLHAPI